MSQVNGDLAGKYSTSILSKLCFKWSEAWLMAPEFREKRKIGEGVEE